MQRAARRVAQENERLRILLARHGVLKEDVDSFLRSCEATDGSAEPGYQTPGVRNSSGSSPYVNATGPRSIHTTPLSPAFPKEYDPRLPPVRALRQPTPTSRRRYQQSDQTSKCGPGASCGPTTGNPTTAQTDAAIMSRTVEACRQAESYYASPSETDSSPPRPQEDRAAFTYSKHVPAVTQRQERCPLPEPRPEVTMEDADCPSTADCFCPPTATEPPSTCGSSVGNDEISCETAASIIAQMRGDEDDAAARASIGCGPGQVCTIKNSFLMQVLDER